MQTPVLMLATLTTLALTVGCGKAKKSSPAPQPQTPPSSALTLGQPLAISGPTADLGNPLEDPFKAELDEILSFSLAAPATLQVNVTEVAWADGCGKTGGPFIAYGPHGSDSMTALADGQTVFPDQTPTGNYDLLVTMTSEQACTLKSAKVTLAPAP